MIEVLTISNGLNLKLALNGEPLVGICHHFVPFFLKFLLHLHQVINGEYHEVRVYQALY